MPLCQFWRSFYFRNAKPEINWINVADISEEDETNKYTDMLTILFSQKMSGNITFKT